MKERWRYWIFFFTQTFETLCNTLPHEDSQGSFNKEDGGEGWDAKGYLEGTKQVTVVVDENEMERNALWTKCAVCENQHTAN